MGKERSWLSTAPVYCVAFVLQDFSCSEDGVFVVELDAENTALGFAVVSDSDVFDADIVFCHNGSNRCQGTGLIGDVNLNCIIPLNGAAGGVDKGISVNACTVKKVV